MQQHQDQEEQQQQQQQHEQEMIVPTAFTSSSGTSQKDNCSPADSDGNICLSGHGSSGKIVFCETTEVTIRRDDNTGNKIINQYLVVSDLGKGSFAKVKLAIHKESHRLVAIKVVNKSLLNRAARLGFSADSFRTEVAIMKRLKHRHVVSLYEVIDDPSAHKVYIVMRYCNKGPIRKLRDDGTCAPMPEEAVVRATRQICSGLAYLHRRRIIHRDIKPDNILIHNVRDPDNNNNTALLSEDDVVFLSDFGISTMLSDSPEPSPIEQQQLLIFPTTTAIATMQQQQQQQQQQQLLSGVSPLISPRPHGPFDLSHPTASVANSSSNSSARQQQQHHQQHQQHPAVSNNSLSINSVALSSPKQQQQQPQHRQFVSVSCASPTTPAPPSSGSGSNNSQQQQPQYPFATTTRSSSSNSNSKSASVSPALDSTSHPSPLLLPPPSFRSQRDSSSGGGLTSPTGSNSGTTTAAAASRRCSVEPHTIRSRMDRMRAALEERQASAAGASGVAGGGSAHNTPRTSSARYCQQHDDDDQNFCLVGTPAFLSPEQCAGKATADKHGKSNDAWALGVTLFTLLTGRLPFTGALRDMMWKIQQSDPSFPEQADLQLSEQCVEVLRGLLCKDPKKRMTVTQLRAHPWLERKQRPVQTQQTGNKPATAAAAVATAAEALTTHEQEQHRHHSSSRRQSTRNEGKETEEEEKQEGEVTRQPQETATRQDAGEPTEEPGSTTEDNSGTCWDVASPGSCWSETGDLWSCCSSPLVERPGESGPEQEEEQEEGDKEEHQQEQQKQRTIGVPRRRFHSHRDCTPPTSDAHEEHQQRLQLQQLREEEAASAGGSGSRIPLQFQTTQPFSSKQNSEGLLDESFGAASPDSLSLSVSPSTNANTISAEEVANAIVRGDFIHFSEVCNAQSRFGRVGTVVLCMLRWIRRVRGRKLEEQQQERKKKATEEEAELGPTDCCAVCSARRRCHRASLLRHRGAEHNDTVGSHHHDHHNHHHHHPRLEMLETEAVGAESTSISTSATTTPRKEGKELPPPPPPPPSLNSSTTSAATTASVTTSPWKMPNPLLDIVKGTSTTSSQALPPPPPSSSSPSPSSQHQQHSLLPSRLQQQPQQPLHARQLPPIEATSTAVAPTTFSPRKASSTATASLPSQPSRGSLALYTESHSSSSRHELYPQQQQQQHNALAPSAEPVQKPRDLRSTTTEESSSTQTHTSPLPSRFPSLSVQPKKGNG